MTNPHIKTLVGTFNNLRKPDHRYASFDYCFNYFRNFKEGRLSELKSEDNMEMSCLHIGFFLASWGMFRMSGKLGQQVSLKHFAKLITEISEWDKNHKLGKVWSIDANDYANANKRQCLLDCYRKISALTLPNGQGKHITLVTKIMLGIFGCVPAFDKFFTETFALAKFDEPALEEIGKFYEKHHYIIDQLAEKSKTLEFGSGKETKRCYSKAKIIDMIGFQEGKNKADAAKAKKRAEQEAAKRKNQTDS